MFLLEKYFILSHKSLQTGLWLESFSGRSYKAEMREAVPVDYISRLYITSNKCFSVWIENNINDWMCYFSARISEISACSISSTCLNWTSTLWALPSPGLKSLQISPTFTRLLLSQLQHWAMAGRGGPARANGTAASNKICQFKLVLLGESAVGKSSLVLRFVKGQFHEYQESTIGGEHFIVFHFQGLLSHAKWQSNCLLVGLDDFCCHSMFWWESSRTGSLKLVTWLSHDPALQSWMDFVESNYNSQYLLTIESLFVGKEWGCRNQKGTQTSTGVSWTACRSVKLIREFLNFNCQRTTEHVQIQISKQNG